MNEKNEGRSARGMAEGKANCRHGGGNSQRHLQGSRLNQAGRGGQERRGVGSEREDGRSKESTWEP